MRARMFANGCARMADRLKRRSHYSARARRCALSPKAWNYPVNLLFGPLAGALAAGNRVMLKPSELTPATADLLERLVRLNFDEEELAVIPGGRDVGVAFSRLPFDHLVYTGSTAVGREVMAAAAEHLTPLTLELGGKCPAIISASADIAVAAARIMAGKLLNAGQTCLAPDYVLAPRDKMDVFVEAAKAAVATMFPRLRDNPDYTAIINTAHYDRLRGLIADASAKGATAVEINPRGEDFTTQQYRKLPPTLLLSPGAGARVLQEELFGPVLTVITCDTAEEAIAYVNARPRPLALYWFGQDDAECEHVLARTVSGGVTINDVIYHFGIDDLPFGGVGASGFGRYHGKEGFLEFSNARAVYRQVRSELIARLRPPYGERFREFIRDRMK
jgi:coniferyl-aldehyde dehydrogenase